MAVDVLRRGADKKLRQFMSIIGSFTCGLIEKFSAFPPPILMSDSLDPVEAQKKVPNTDFH